MSTYPSDGMQGVKPSDLDWLAGTWLGKVGDAVIEEHWGTYLGGMLVGTFRWSEQDEITFYEIEAIETDDTFCYLRIRHFDKGLIAWEEKESPHEFILVKYNERILVFFELDKPDPRWAVYERENPNKMRVYFTHDSEPDDHPGVFHFNRLEVDS